MDSIDAERGSAAPARGPFIGRPMPRFEDLRLVRGGGRYTDDVSVPQQAFALFVRSPHAHARLISIDTSAAASRSGVLALLTGRDYVADGHLGMSHQPNPADALDVRKPSFAPAADFISSGCRPFSSAFQVFFTRSIVLSPRKRLDVTTPITPVPSSSRRRTSSGGGKDLVRTVFTFPRKAAAPLPSGVTTAKLVSPMYSWGVTATTVRIRFRCRSGK